MRGRMAGLMFMATSAQAGADPAHCLTDDTVRISGVISEIATTDPAVPEIILDRVSSKCKADAIRMQGAVPDNCGEGRKITAEGTVQQSGDGTWTWLNADSVKCE